jgi:AraC family ethanolamine operon transcriptional activator
LENKILIQHYEFNDFDHFSEMIKQGKLEQDQLDKGGFIGNLSQIVHGPISIARHKMNRTVLQKGSGNKGNTIFIIPGNMEQKIHWRNHDLTGNSIGILKFGMEHESITVSSFLAYSVSISNQYLEEMSALLGFPKFLIVAKTHEVIEIPKNYAIEIQKLLTNIFNSKILIESVLNYELPRLIITSICNMNNQCIIKSGKPRNLIFKRAQSFIDSNIRENMNILSLSKELGISERNLRYVFHDKVGFGPKKYISNYKLNKVRKELKNKRNIPIKALASEFGFWHTGKFAADYKMLFGEFPSETNK